MFRVFVLPLFLSGSTSSYLCYTMINVFQIFVFFSIYNKTLTIHDLSVSLISNGDQTVFHFLYSCVPRDWYDHYWMVIPTTHVSTRNIKRNLKTSGLYKTLFNFMCTFVFVWEGQGFILHNTLSYCSRGLYLNLFWKTPSL